MNTTKIGRQAEENAIKYLKNSGYKILTKNWRNRWCEIDIVATKKNIAYLVEVKYRKSSNWGDGLEAITLKKQKQMGFAAELWVSQNDWQGDYNLLAISLEGVPPNIVDCIEIG